MKETEQMALWYITVFFLFKFPFNAIMIVSMWWIMVVKERRSRVE